LLCAASSVTGQTPPPQLGQDELDLQARANVVQGSGARALGMGGAFLARADDATAASWNPAGLSYLRLPEISFVYSGSRLDSLEASSTSRKDDRRHGHTPDFFAAAYPFELGRVSGSAQVSFQRLISFDGERTINETFLDATGQVVSTPPSVVTSAGGYDVVAFGTGVAVGANLRVGATVNRWFNGYHQTLDRDTLRGGIPGHTTQEFDYDFSAWNLNLGLMWSPHPDLNLGAVYKSAFTADVQLNKSRQDVTVPPSSNQASSAEHPITLDFPAAFGLGGSWRPRSRLTVSADYTRTAWSKGEIHNFFSLPQARPGPGTPTIYPSLPYPSLNTDPTQLQHDTVQVRGGVEFVFILGRVKLPVRAGAFSDRQYVQASDGTPPHFTGLTAGTGVVIGPILVDVAFIRERGHYQAPGTDAAGTAVSVRSRRLVGSVIFRVPRH
jgi:long-subunit fatty acid transport protein